LRPCALLGRRILSGAGGADVSRGLVGVPDACVSSTGRMSPYRSGRRRVSGVLWSRSRGPLISSGRRSRWITGSRSTRSSAGSGGRISMTGWARACHRWSRRTWWRSTPASHRWRQAGPRRTAHHPSGPSWAFVRAPGGTRRGCHDGLLYASHRPENSPHGGMLTTCCGSDPGQPDFNRPV
jgi:hypothetical protein